MIIKVGQYKVKRNYKPAQIIFDAFSLAVLCLIIINLVAIIKTADAVYVSWLPVLIWVAATVSVLALSLFFTFKYCPLTKKIKITKKNVQKYYNSIMFAVSALRFIALWEISELLYIHGRRILREEANFFTGSIVCGIILAVITVILTKRLILAAVKPDNEKPEIKITEH